MSEPRLGQRQGFQDVQRAQVHAAATAIMNATRGSIHENVIGYDPSFLEENCKKHSMEMAVPLVSDVNHKCHLRST